MTCDDIISRASYNVGDEMFKESSQDQYLRMLRRAYRNFAEKTKLVRNGIQFSTSANVVSYKLFGNDETGKLFGDNILGFYRVDWSSDGGTTFRKAFETDLDTIKNSFSQGGFADIDDADASANMFGVGDDILFYTINYFQDALWIIFTNLTPASLIIKMWYYELPSITTCLPTLLDTPQFDQKYHDDLVLGLEYQAWRRRVVKAIADEKNGQLIKLYITERDSIKAQWMARLDEIHREVQSFKDDTIPMQVMPQTAFDQWAAQDTNNEQDEDLY